MKIEYPAPSQLSPEEARERLAALGEYLTNRHGIHVSWNGDKALFKGKYLVVNIDGEMSYEGHTVHFDGKDPGMLFRKKATNYIIKKLDKYLDPGQPLDELPRG